MPPAARVTDATTHPLPPVLNPGPGSTTVMIGFLPAWRALPSGAGGALDAVSNAMNSFMTKPVMTPADSASDVVQISVKMTQLGAQAAADGAPSAAAAASSSVSTMMATYTALTATWTAASAVPGGQPAANTAFTEGIKASAAAAATAVVSSMAGMADMHTCTTPVPIPPHGPGFVTKGSSSVMVDGLALSRQGDKVMEAAGGANPISIGCTTVMVGG